MPLKTLDKSDVSIRPFKTHKAQSYVYTSGSSTNPSEIFIDITQLFTDVNLFVSGSSPVNSSGIHQEPLHNSIRQIFYTPAQDEFSASLAKAVSDEILINGSFSRWEDINLNISNGDFEN